MESETSRSSVRRQDVLFDTNEKPTLLWGWVVVYRLFDSTIAHPEGEWGEWGTARHPNHFRSEEGAAARVAELGRKYSEPVAKGWIEFRCEAKYLGYIPSEDEAWIHP
jgi:hypothetical protein